MAKVKSTPAPLWLSAMSDIVDGLPAWASRDRTGGTRPPTVGCRRAAKRALRAAAAAGLDPSRVIGGADGDIAILFSAAGRQVELAIVSESTAVTTLETDPLGEAEFAEWGTDGRSLAEAVRVIADFLRAGAEAEEAA
jgi:hypothetical protein